MSCVYHYHRKKKKKKRLKFMVVFKSVTCEFLQSGYADILCYAQQYCAIDKIKPMNLWSEICLRNKGKES